MDVNPIMMKLMKRHNTSIKLTYIYSYSTSIMSTMRINQAMTLTGSLISIDELPTEIKLEKLFEEEEGDMIVMEFCQELMSNVMNCIQANHLTDQTHDFVVECALEALKKTVAINYTYHNGPFDFFNGDNWKPDQVCQPSNADTWGAYRVPVTYDSESDELIQKQEVEEQHPETISPKEEIQQIFNPFCASGSSSNSSQDLMSIIDYLEDILSTSSEEEIDAASYVTKESQRNDSLSDKISGRLSQLSGKSSVAEKELSTPILSEKDRFLSLNSNKAALGETEKGLCIPNVANIPYSTVFEKYPEVGEFTLVKVGKRKTKVTKKKTGKSLPVRRAEIKIKIDNVNTEKKEK